MSDDMAGVEIVGPTDKQVSDIAHVMNKTMNDNGAFMGWGEHHYVRDSEPANSAMGACFSEPNLEKFKTAAKEVFYGLPEETRKGVQLKLFRGSSRNVVLEVFQS